MNINNNGLDLDNYNIWYTPFWKTNLFYFVASTIFFFVLLFIFIFILKNFILKKTISIAEECFNQLNDLESNCNDIKIFYEKLFFLLKKYLSYYFNLKFYSITENELINFIELNFDVQVNTVLMPIIKRAQIAKFATLVIDKNNAIHDLKEIRLLIESLQRLNVQKSKSNKLGA